MWLLTCYWHAVFSTRLNYMDLKKKLVSDVCWLRTQELQVWVLLTIRFFSAWPSGKINQRCQRRTWRTHAPFCDKAAAQVQWVVGNWELTKSNTETPRWPTCMYIHTYILYIYYTHTYYIYTYIHIIYTHTYIIYTTYHIYIYIYTYYTSFIFT